MAAIYVERGDLIWRMSVSESGQLPFDNTYPGLLEWKSSPPMSRLTDQGVRLAALVISHPQADDLSSARQSLSDPRLAIEIGPPGLRATFNTPNGLQAL